MCRITIFHKPPTYASVSSQGQAALLSLHVFSTQQGASLMKDSCWQKEESGKTWPCTGVRRCSDQTTQSLSLFDTLTDAHTQKLKIFSVLWQEDPLFNKLFVNTAKDEKSYCKTQFQVPKYVVLRSNIFKNRFVSKMIGLYKATILKSTTSCSQNQFSWSFSDKTSMLEIDEWKLI